MPAEDGAPATDRRGRRRLETVEEILDVAAEIMAEQGAGGLTLGELARRMGIRPPSLYGYVDSKTALYDALFERGWTRLNQTMATQLAGVGDAPEPTAQALTAAETFVRWSVENAAYAQLMFWRPVPGFEPSARAYAPALEAMRGAREAFAVLQDRGVLAMTSDLDEALDAWVVIVSGVVSQQLSNAPHDAVKLTAAMRALDPHAAVVLDAARGRLEVLADASGTQILEALRAIDAAARPLEKEVHISGASTCCGHCG